MKKGLLFLLLLSLTASALADLSRAERQERLEQALAALRQGDQIWRARIEDDAAGGRVGNLFLQFPGKFLVDYDSGNDILSDGKSLASYRGASKINDFKLEEDPLYLVTQGELGSTLAIEMLALDSLGYYGEDLRVVVADLVLNKERSPKTRVRLFIRAQGKAELLALGYPTSQGYQKLWLRDFHPVTPKTDPFKRSVL